MENPVFAGEGRIALSTQDAAEAIGCHRGTLYKLWREQKGPPFVKVGADRRVLVTDLRAWMESLKVAA